MLVEFHWMMSLREDIGVDIVNGFREAVHNANIQFLYNGEPRSRRKKQRGKFSSFLVRRQSIGSVTTRVCQWYMHFRASIIRAIMINGYRRCNWSIRNWSGRDCCLGELTGWQTVCNVQCEETLGLNRTCVLCLVLVVGMLV